MNLPEGEVKQWQVLEWVGDQAQYLTPTQHHLLLHLSINSFYSSNNKEGVDVGQVLAKRATQASIQVRTGLSRRTIYRALEELISKGYVHYSPGSGTCDPQIYVLWAEVFETMREEMRAGARSLPESFQRSRKPNKRVLEQKEKNVIRLSDRNK